MTDIKLPDGRTAQVVEPQQQNTPVAENPANFDTYIVFLENLRRMKQHLTTVPTLTPKNFLEQIQFYDDGTVKKLYLYINKIWQAFVPSAAATFGGSVVSNAAGSFFPSGWSVSNDGAGLYTITHNLGTTNYSVTVSPNVFNTRFAVIYSKTSSTFSVGTFVLAGTPTNTDFEFILTK